MLALRIAGSLAADKSIAPATWSAPSAADARPVTGPRSTANEMPRPLYVSVTNVELRLPVPVYTTRS
jgi:hypothetical protein